MQYSHLFAFVLGTCINHFWSHIQLPNCFFASFVLFFRQNVRNLPEQYKAYCVSWSAFCQARSQFVPAWLQVRLPVRITAAVWVDKQIGFIHVGVSLLAHSILWCADDNSIIQTLRSQLCTTLQVQTRSMATMSQVALVPDWQFLATHRVTRRFHTVFISGGYL